MSNTGLTGSRGREALAAIVAACALTTGCSSGGGSPNSEGSSDLARVQSALDAFVNDAKAGAPRVAETETTLNARLDEPTLRNLVKLLVRVFEARSGDAGATAELRTLTDTVLARLGDVAYVDAVAHAEAAVATRALGSTDACAGFQFDC